MLLELALDRGLRRVLVADSGKDVSEADIAAMSSLRSGFGVDGSEPSVFERVPRELLSQRITE